MGEPGRLHHYQPKIVFTLDDQSYHLGTEQSDPDLPDALDLAGAMAIPQKLFFDSLQKQRPAHLGYS